MATGVDDRVTTQTVQAGAAQTRTTAGQAVLFADFEDCTSLPQSAASGERTRKLTTGPGELTDRIVQAHQGQTIKVMGPSFLAEFPTPASAVRAAMEIERLSAESDRDDGSAGPRIGIHLAGTGGMLDGFSRAIHVAAGITKHAAVGQILVSSEIREAIRAEADLACHRPQMLSVDGEDARLEVFQVQWAEVAASIPTRYELLSRVGTGGMGIVYKVRDREINDIIALKVLKSGIADDPAMQENLRREVSLARKVTHKNVCRIHEFNRSGSMAYVSMEFIEGESLLAKLRGGPLSWNDALPIAQQICSGLREAHLQGIVHRDLKPANIMVDASGTVKITDFGIARVFQGTGQMTGTLIGTPAYMAPEQVELKRIDARTDIYALGLLLYEIVTAAPAFHGDTPIAVAVKQLREFPKRPRLIVPTLPPHAEAIIVKCLHKDPAKRFQSIDELALALSRPQQPQPTAAAWRSIAKQTAHISRVLHRQLKARADAGYRFIESQNWRQIYHPLTTKRARPALVAALGALCVLTGVLAVAPRLHSKKPAPDAVTAKAPGMQAGSVIVTGGKLTDVDDVHNGVAPAVQDSPQGAQAVNDYAVDLAYSEVSTQKMTQAAAKPASTIAPKSPKPALATHANAAPALAANDRKVRPANVETIAPRTTTSIVAPANAPALDAAAPSLPAKADSAEATKPSAAPSTSPGSSPNVAAGNPPEKTEEVQSTKEDSPQTAHYFSVGTFKDATWADEAVAKLVQLGFPALSVHKKTLWIQSYEVRVGPYEHPEDLDAAGKQLREFGFKPHPVK